MMWPFSEDNINEFNETSTTISPFFTELVFESLHELMEWVQNKANLLGYVIVIGRSKAKERGMVSYVTLICDRGGEYRFKVSSKHSGTKKTNCEFKLVGSYQKRYGGWTLRVICDKHNHEPVEFMEGHPYVKRLKPHEKQMVADLTNQNVTPSDILSILKERDDKNVSTLKTIYNARHKIRSSQKDGKTLMQLLMDILKEKNFLIEYTVNGISNQLENLFFVHPLSLKIWQAFPHVLIIDATYKTNKYCMPFVQIVGLTSTNKTFSIAFAFIINERVENYKWTLTCLKLTLERCMQPRVIVTDRELALMNACQHVFPDAARLLCRWRITENIRKNCRSSIELEEEWNSFRAMWRILVNSPTWMLYIENYQKLQSLLSEYQGVLVYLDDVWLNNYKEMFVSAWIDQHLNFGERTSNRVESQHARLKKYLREKNNSLDKFVGCIDRFVRSQLTEIYGSLEKSRIVLKHEHNLPCFQLLRGFVALEALDILLGELQRLGRHRIDSSNCGCKVRHSCGLPCACMLSVYLTSGECIPLDSIDVFWRKLDLSQSVSMEDEDICCDDELELFKENFIRQSRAAKKSMVRKLLDIFRPSKTLIKEPAIQKNMRGRPSLKKQQQKREKVTNAAPRRRSCSSMPKSFEVENEPARHSSYVTAIPDLNEIPDLDEEPQSFYIHPLMKELPVMFHPYITHIENVNGDGNCGFRAISVCLGYSEDEWLYVKKQLLDELTSSYDEYTRVFTSGIDEVYKVMSFLDSPAPMEYWMLMPETGILIANRFGVILSYLTTGGSLTFFPLWKGPEEFLYHRAITIAHVWGGHYVMVQLEGDYPMPTISAYWKRHRPPCAAGWETMYMPRLELYRQLKPRDPKSPFITIEDC